MSKFRGEEEGEEGVSEEERRTIVATLPPEPVHPDGPWGIERDTLLNATRHLIASNTALSAALVDTPGDEDYIQAIEENKAVIERQLRRIVELNKAIKESRLAASLTSASPLPPPDPPDSMYV